MNASCQVGVARHVKVDDLDQPLGVLASGFSETFRRSGLNETCLDVVGIDEPEKADAFDIRPRVDVYEIFGVVAVEARPLHVIEEGDADLVEVPRISLVILGDVLHRI